MNQTTDDPFERLGNTLRKVLDGISATTTPPPVHTAAPPPVHTASSSVNPAPFSSSAEDCYGLRLQCTPNPPTQPLWFLEESAKVATFVDFPAPLSGCKFAGSFSGASSGAFIFGEVHTAFGDSTAPPSGGRFGGLSSPGSTGAFRFVRGPTDYPSTGSSSAGGFGFRGSLHGVPLVAVPTPEASGERGSDSKPPVSGVQFGGEAAATRTAADTSTAMATTAGGVVFGLPGQEEKPALRQSCGGSASETKAERKDPTPAPANIIGEQSGTPSSTAKRSAAGTLQEASTPPSTEAVSAPANVFREKLLVIASDAAEATVEGPPQKAATTSILMAEPEEKEGNATPSAGSPVRAAMETDKPEPSVGFSSSKPDSPKKRPNPALTSGKPAAFAEATRPTFGFGQKATDNAAPKPAFQFRGGSANAPASARRVF